MVQYKEFRVGDLFDIHPTSAYKLRNAELFDENGVNRVVTNSSVNNGVTGWTNRACTEHGNMITFSDTTTSDAIFYQPFDFVGYPHVQGMYPLVYLNDWNEKTLLYMVALLRRNAAGRFDYATKFTRVIAANMMVMLPVTSSGDPDFAYMAERIAELEAERIAELEAYLVAAGLNDYELTDEDKAVLARNVEMREFRIGDLFEKLESTYYGTGARHSDISDVRTDEYSVPVTTAKKGDNGICRWARPGQFKTYSNVISVVYNGAIAAGLTYYQPDEVSSLADSYLIRLKDGELNEQSGLYLAAAIQKVAKTKFSRENKAVWKRVGAESIALPVTSDGTPDYDYMAAYIRMQEKLAIADAVKLKDRIIAETKAIVA